MHRCNRIPQLPAIVTIMLIAAFNSPLHAQKEAATPGTKTPNNMVPAPRDLFAAQTGPQQITLSWFAPFATAPRGEYVVMCAAGDRTLRNTASAPMRTANRMETGQLMTYVLPNTAQVAYRCHLEIRDSRSSVLRFPFNEVTPNMASTAPPPAPDTLKAELFPPRSVILSWTVAPEATAYRIERRVTRGGSRVLCYLCPPTGNYVDSALVAGADQSYSIVAIGPGGASRRIVSNEVRVDPRAMAGGGGPKVPTATVSAPVIMNVGGTTSPAAAQLARVTVYEDPRTVSQILRLAPGGEVAEHHHPQHNEVLFVHSGTIEVMLGMQTRKLVAGDVAFIPAGTTIRGRNADTQEAQIIVTFSSTGTPAPLTVPGPARR